MSEVKVISATDEINRLTDQVKQLTEGLDNGYLDGYEATINKVS